MHFYRIHYIIQRPDPLIDSLFGRSVALTPTVQWHVIQRHAPQNKRSEIEKPYSPMKVYGYSRKKSPSWDLLEKLQQNLFQFYSKFYSCIPCCENHRNTSKCIRFTQAQNFVTRTRVSVWHHCMSGKIEWCSTAVQGWSTLYIALA